MTWKKHHKIDDISNGVFALSSMDKLPWEGLHPIEPPLSLKFLLMHNDCIILHAHCMHEMAKRKAGADPNLLK
jgi:hypothetical protein